ncbi:MAG: hypothetical protein ACI9S8_000900 [Chlamydiales bacterium]|jgi:hypothetical protein
MARGGTMTKKYALFLFFGVFCSLGLFAGEKEGTASGSEEIIILTLQKLSSEHASLSACSLSFYSMIEEWVEKTKGQNSVVEVMEKGTEGRVQRVTTYLKGAKKSEFVYEDVEKDKLSCLRELSRENFTHIGNESCIDVEKWELKNGRI